MMTENFDKINDWKETSNVKYYYRISDGKVLGAAWHYVTEPNSIWTAKIYAETFPFTNESEKFLGHFINESTARKAVENFWHKNLLTLDNK